jgi:stage III sporulation protein SpoIIIAA
MIQHGRDLIDEVSEIAAVCLHTDMIERTKQRRAQLSIDEANEIASCLHGHDLVSETTGACP